MSVDLRFTVSRDNSGKATYLAIMCHGTTTPYQKPVGNNRCEQDFTFPDWYKMNQFLNLAHTEFVDDFEVLWIRNITK